jgi:hypothetical protein
MASSGPVPGLQGCPVVLPNVMGEFREAWTKATVVGFDTLAEAGAKTVLHQHQ